MQDLRVFSVCHFLELVSLLTWFCCSLILCRECGFFCLGGCEEFYCEGFSCVRKGSIKPSIGTCSDCQGAVCGYCIEQLQCGRCADCCRHSIANASSDFLRREANMIQLKLDKRFRLTDRPAWRGLAHLQNSKHQWRSWNHSISDHPDGWLFRTRVECEGCGL